MRLECGAIEALYGKEWSKLSEKATGLYVQKLSEFITLSDTPLFDALPIDLASDSLRDSERLLERAESPAGVDMRRSLQFRAQGVG